MAVSRLGAGARGPHVIDGPASWAFDAQIKGRPFGQHLVAVSASDLVVLVCSRHFLMVLGLRPRIRPDMRLRARHEHKQQAETLHDDYSIVWGRGPVVVHRAGGGGSNLPRLCLKRL